MNSASRRSMGLEGRTRVIGMERARESFEQADELSMPLQEIATDFAWGDIWTRPGLDLRARSIFTIGILITQRCNDELKVHLRGGLTNGLSVTEVQEIVLQSAVYAGFCAPA